MKNSESDVNRGWTIKWELSTEWAPQPDKFMNDWDPLQFVSYSFQILKQNWLSTNCFSNKSRVTHTWNFKEKKSLGPLTYFPLPRQGLYKTYKVWDLLCRPCWPQTQRDPPVSTTQVLGLKACITTPANFNCFYLGRGLLKLHFNVDPSMCVCVCTCMHGCFPKNWGRELEGIAQ